MYWGPTSNENRPDFTPKFTNPPKYVTVFTGAGTSVTAGCPLMRGFIDRAIDLNQKNYFLTPDDKKCVESTINLYKILSSSFSITEEDIENIETILSIVDMSNIMENIPISELRKKNLSDSVRNFIDLVVTKSVTVPSPTSGIWYKTTGYNEMALKQLIKAISYHGDKASIITTNYDCLLEYYCHSLGVPFTYNRKFGDGIEILKLHGSINWVQCSNSTCKTKPFVSRMSYVDKTELSGYGFLERQDHQCTECEYPLVPIIIPPSMSKQFDIPILKNTWSRALESLSLSESFVSTGYSLPMNDTHVKHLFHLGFSSGKLRQALVVNGEDEKANERWDGIFREFWKNARLTILNSTFEDSMDSAIRKALLVPVNYSFSNSILSNLLPIEWGTQPEKNNENKLKQEKEKNIEEKFLDNSGWITVAENYRNNTGLEHESNRRYRELFKKANLNWYPTNDILPVHGNIFKY